MRKKNPIKSVKQSSLRRMVKKSAVLHPKHDEAEVVIVFKGADNLKRAVEYAAALKCKIQKSGLQSAVSRIELHKH